MTHDARSCGRSIVRVRFCPCLLPPFFSFCRLLPFQSFIAVLVFQVVLPIRLIATASRDAFSRVSVSFRGFQAASAELEQTQLSAGLSVVKIGPARVVPLLLPDSLALRTREPRVCLSCRRHTVSLAHTTMKRTTPILGSFRLIFPLLTFTDIQDTVH